MSHRFGIVLLLAFFSQAPAYHVPVPVKAQQYVTSPEYADGEYAEKGQFPFQVAMYLDERGFCGGSLISTRWILTAAQCVELTKTFTVHLGALELNSTSEPGRLILNTRTGITHEEFYRPLSDNNIGLVQLPTDIQPNSQIDIISLPPRSYNNRYYEMLHVRIIGWGSFLSGSTPSSNRLQFTDRFLMSDQNCKIAYRNPTLASINVVCLSDSLNDNGCNDDAGGPMISRKGDFNFNKTLLIGLASYKPKNCYNPTIYTRTYMFLDWISQKTGIPIVEDWKRPTEE